MNGLEKITFILLFFTLGNLSNGQEKDTKYPDLIVEAYYSGYFDVFDSLYGGKGIDSPIRIDVNKILGENKDQWFVSLPTGSYITLQYTDNEIIDAPNQNDIIVVDYGCCEEYIKVSASYDGNAFTELGIISGCDNEIDLAKTHYKQPVRFLKIEGLDVKCASPGFDLISAYALPGANRDLYFNMDEVDSFFESKEYDKALIMENVYFENDSYSITKEAEKDLLIVLNKLQHYPNIEIKITGHTDSNATEDYNLNLSNLRAESVKQFLILKGIDNNRMTTEGKGETSPLKPNVDEIGRTFNRRVELRMIN